MMRGGMMRQRIGPYQVVSELGRGGMGVVYRARGSSGEVAVKVMQPAASAEARGSADVDRLRLGGQVPRRRPGAHVGW